MFNDRIKEVRKALKLSQRAFGEKLGVSRDVISNLEYNRVEPKTVFIQHMCEAYGINEHWIQTGEGQMFDDNTYDVVKINEAIEIFKTLSADFQDCALEQIKKLVELQNKQ